jgi:hypothetical protein
MNQYLQEQAVLYVSKLKQQEQDHQDSEEQHIHKRQRLTLSALIARFFGQRRRTDKQNAIGRALPEQ